MEIYLQQLKTKMYNICGHLKKFPGTCDVKKTHNYTFKCYNLGQ